MDVAENKGPKEHPGAGGAPVEFRLGDCIAFARKIVRFDCRARIVREQHAEDISADFSPRLVIFAPRREKGHGGPRVRAVRYGNAIRDLFAQYSKEREDNADSLVPYRSE